MNARVVYKILSERAWAIAQRASVIEGSELDRADGFIHLSSATQVAETLARHFPRTPGLLLVAFDANSLGDACKWEPSRGGELFPHHYGALSVDEALWAAPLRLDDLGLHVLPDTMT